MKKITLLFLILFFSLLKISSQNLEIVMPKIVYVGDTVEIRYVFHSEAKLFNDNFVVNNSYSAQLDPSYPFFKEYESDFTVTEVQIEKAGSQYTLYMKVNPWKTGYLIIPPFNLTNLVRFSQNDFSNNYSASVMIELSPIEINSILKKTSRKNFMAASSPIVLPGTSAMLALFLIVAVFLFSILIFILLHLTAIQKFISTITYLYALRKNSRKAIRKINHLKKESQKISSDKDFAARLQHILRDFLNKRFARDFSAITTGMIYNIFLELCGGNLTSHQEETIDELVALFTRLEYIRFSSDSSFKSEDNERITICEKSVTLIENFDMDEENEHDSL